jgi:hypothetical protein
MEYLLASVRFAQSRKGLTGQDNTLCKYTWALPTLLFFKILPGHQWVVISGQRPIKKNISAPSR